MSYLDGANEIYFVVYPGILFGVRTYQEIYKHTKTNERIRHTTWVIYLPFVSLQFGFYKDIPNESES